MWFESAQVELVRDTFPEWMAFLFAFLSYLGSVWFVAPAVVLAYWFRDRHRFASWIGIVMGGYAVMLGLKGIFETPRPGVGPAIVPDALPTVVALLYAPAVEVSTTSFPSGHAVAATVIWTMVALESDVATGRLRLLGAAAMVVLVGFARVGAGVHFPIDVLVGIVAGVCYLCVVLSIRRRTREQGEHVAVNTTFTVAAALALVAFWTSGRPDTMALFGGCVGALLAWQYATPPREPWPMTLGVVIHAVLGIGVLALVALVLLVTTHVVVWLAVGLTGGVLVLGLPRLVGRTTASPSRAEVVG
ncbi:phosphatase PAP2 family protein [Natronorubrum sp. JWXQ-INN-674]|uniref:Phosphatase PAP2 family protein n=1 Tax=Natronorubrum halalkaliphilum TaxID=2691917 RepID=A0A6B0VQM0_9EURY|nr:phosphatase PAP2 family protein [Natronorubrum halalkaliphilum]MXV63082.1 phosphatase PAP2 family protein [Natronorubrum halalkaliphilum]